ncbi:MAG: hypothetical protein WBO77_04035 [Microgenomates group bacterium]
MKKQKHHAWYLVLGSIAALLLVALYYSRGNNQVQFYIVSLFVAIYVIWGVLHHIIDNSLRLSVVLEYILLSATALFLLKTVLLK